jgi:hypothetical protein
MDSVAITSNIRKATAGFPCLPVDLLLPSFVQYPVGPFFLRPYLPIEFLLPILPVAPEIISQLVSLPHTTFVRPRLERWPQTTGKLTLFSLWHISSSVVLEADPPSIPSPVYAVSSETPTRTFPSSPFDTYGLI